MQSAVVVENLGTGLAAGAVALGVMALGAVLVRRIRRGIVLPIAGVGLVAASAVALDRADRAVEPGVRLWIGLVLLVVGPVVAAVLARSARRVGRNRVAGVAGAVAAVPGAAVVAWAASAPTSTEWVAPVVCVSTVVGGALVDRFDRANAAAGLGPLLLAVSVVGAFATLPDTEEVAVVLGVAVLVAVLGWPVVLASLGPGAYGAVGLLGWVAAVGGRGRPGAVVGALACLGLMLVEPLVRGIGVRGVGVRRVGGRREPATPPAPWPTGYFVALDLVVVGVTSRVAGLETAGVRATVIALFALGAGATALLVIQRSHRAERAPRPQRS